MQFAYYRYEANLQKLKPGTEYGYRVLVNDSAIVSDGLKFRTAGTQAFRFVAFGDSGMGSEAQRKLANLMTSQNAKLVVHTGDLVYPSGTYERYERLYFEYYKDIMKEAPFYPCPGNHDYYEFHCAPYKSVHSLPTETVAASDSGRYYSYDWGNVHFISLDSNDSLAEAVRGKGAMLEWLEKDLQRTDKYWRIVYIHHPAYSVGWHKNEPECEMVRQYIAPILDKYFVPLVLNGHEHSYQRTFPIRSGKVTSAGDGTVYVTTGGGGADLHEVSAADHAEVVISQHHYVSCNVNGGRLQFDAVNPDGQLLDSHTIAPKPLISGQPVVNSANYGPMLASGGLMTIFGQQFCPEEFTPARYPLPKSALGVSALLNDQPLPILMASARQLNVQLPFDAVGEATLTIRTPNGSAAMKVAINPVAPAIFAGALFHANGLQVSKETPAAAGEIITIYLTGLGAVASAVVPGEASPPNVAVTNPVLIKVAGTDIAPQFAGLAAGLSGVYAVTFRVPSGLRQATDVYVTAAGFESNKEVLFAA
jgi:acid phosphatase type 7